MIRLFSLFLLLSVLCACTAPQEEIVYVRVPPAPDAPLVFNPDYNRLNGNVVVVSKSASHVTYEYKNIRVDELGAIAAQYCHDRGGLQAVLHDVSLYRNNSRRANFACRRPSEN